MPPDVLESDPSQPSIVEIARYTRLKEARECGLALSARGITHSIGREGEIWLLRVASPDLAAALEAGECSDAMLADSEETRAMLWRMRESTPDCTKQAGPAIATDCAVPVSAVPLFLEQVHAISAARWPEGHVMCIGHLGDGNIHISLQAYNTNLLRCH
jgi:FAD/FMN-containing dehydrogenase